MLSSVHRDGKEAGMAIQQKRSVDKPKEAAQQRPKLKPDSEGPVSLPEPGVPGALRRAVTQPGRLTPGHVQMLQRSFGNRAVVGLLPRTSSRLPIQAKLTVNPVGDAYEREADRVAEQVVGALDGGQHGVQRQEEDEAIQTQALSGIIQRLPDGGGTVVAPELEDEIKQARGGGQHLSGDVREPMEQAFGADFSGVRVHTDANADALSQSLQARAFTTGQDIFFKSGEYNSASSSGKQLLAHELTHTRQQGATNRLARWGGFGTSHAEVTKKALERAKSSKFYTKPIAEQIERHSKNLDWVENGPGTTTGPSQLKKAIKKKKNKKEKHEAWKALEGTSYKDGGQEPYMISHASGVMYDSNRSESAAEAATNRRVAGWLGIAEREAVAGRWNEAALFLGFALHTAEDIDAHKHGAPGRGHDPRRFVKPPLKNGEKSGLFVKGAAFGDCDDKSTNPDGYNSAVERATRLLVQFAKHVTEKRQKNSETPQEPKLEDKTESPNFTGVALAMSLAKKKASGYNWWKILNKVKPETMGGIEEIDKLRQKWRKDKMKKGHKKQMTEKAYNLSEDWARKIQTLDEQIKKYRHEQLPNQIKKLEGQIEELTKKSRWHVVGKKRVWRDNMLARLKDRLKWQKEEKKVLDQQIKKEKKKKPPKFGRRVIFF
jgi:hypothetical protein